MASGCIKSTAKPLVDNAQKILTWQAPPSPMPGLGTLGLGLDSYATGYQLRNRVLDFDYEIPQEPWKSAEVGGVFHEPETETLYAVPRGVGVDHENQRGLGRVIVEESRSHFESAFTESLEVSGSYGMFSASVNESFSTTSSMDEESWYCQRTQEVTNWTMWATEHVGFDAAFVERVDALPDNAVGNANRQAYLDLIEDFGVLVVSRVTLGGRIEYNAIKQKTEEDTAFSVQAGFEASYAVNFDAKGSAAYEGKATEFRGSSEVRVNVVGGDASEAGMLMDNGGSTLEWSKTVSRDPAVMASAYVPIYDLIDRIGTSRDPDSLPAKQEALRQTVQRYAREQNPTVRVSVVAGRPGDGATVIHVGHASVAGRPDDFPGKHLPCIRATVLSSAALDVISDEYFIPYETSVKLLPATRDPRQETIDAIRKLAGYKAQLIVIATCIEAGEFGKTRANAVLDTVELLRKEEPFASILPQHCKTLSDHNYAFAGIQNDGGTDSVCLPIGPKTAFINVVLHQNPHRYEVDHG